MDEQSYTWPLLRGNDRKSRHRRIKKQRRYERLAATSQLSLWYDLFWVCFLLSCFIQQEEEDNSVSSGVLPDDTFFWQPPFRGVGLYLKLKLSNWKLNRLPFSLWTASNAFLFKRFRTWLRIIQSCWLLPYPRSLPRPRSDVSIKRLVQQALRSFPQFDSLASFSNDRQIAIWKGLAEHFESALKSYLKDLLSK